MGCASSNHTLTTQSQQRREEKERPNALRPVEVRVGVISHPSFCASIGSTSSPPAPMNKRDNNNKRGNDDDHESSDLQDSASAIVCGESITIGVDCQMTIVEEGDESCESPRQTTIPTKSAQLPVLAVHAAPNTLQPSDPSFDIPALTTGLIRIVSKQTDPDNGNVTYRFDEDPLSSQGSLPQDNSVPLSCELLMCPPGNLTANDYHSRTVRYTHILIRGSDEEGNKVINQYAVVGLLGRGSYAKVKLAIDTTNDTPVAIKVLDRQRLGRISVGGADSPRQSALELVQQEVQIMKTMRHPNLVRLYDVIDAPTSNKLYLVMEYMAGGTLCRTPMEPSDDCCEESQTLGAATPDHVATVRARFLDVLHGLEYLHRRGVAHMDIKPENVLLDEQGNCKLADFGVSHMFDASRRVSVPDLVVGTRGTPMYFAPEAVEADSYGGKAADVWALGVTMYVYVTGRHPYVGRTLAETTTRIISPQCDVPELPLGVPWELADVLRRMMCRDPSRRSKVRDLVQHPFFTDRVVLWWSVRHWKDKMKSQ